jgi:hypothetical protein
MHIVGLHLEIYSFSNFIPRFMYSAFLTSEAISLAWNALRTYIKK